MKDLMRDLTLGAMGAQWGLWVLELPSGAPYGSTAVPTNVAGPRLPLSPHQAWLGESHSL